MITGLFYDFTACVCLKLDQSQLLRVGVLLHEYAYKNPV